MKNSRMYTPSAENAFSYDSNPCENQEGSTTSEENRQIKYEIKKPDFFDNLTDDGKSDNVDKSPNDLYNWQSSKSHIKDRISFLFNKELLSDVHFIVGKGTQRLKVPAHKFILSAGSAVFDALFNGRMATTSDEIELPDVEPTAFLSLLCFLYSDEVKIDAESVMMTLYTAKKYAVPALETACVDFLKSSLNSENAFMLLTQARLFDEPQLAALCLDMIDKNTNEALAADGFVDIDKDTLCAVLDRDTLRIREAKLFQAILRWAKSECNRLQETASPEKQRTVLGKALDLIRFPLMTIEEFATGPAQSSILKDSEIVQLFLYFTVNPKPDVSFNDTPRSLITGKELTVNRFQYVESRWGYSGTSDRIRFIVDHKIFVIGFGLYGSIYGSAEYNVNIQIIHNSSGRLCGKQDCSFTSDGSKSTFRVSFPEPIEVLPNINYTAIATIKGSDSHYGSKGLRRVVVNAPNGDAVSFHFTYAAGNNNGTSVEDGQIPEIIFHT